MRILFVITVFLPSRIYGGPATVALNQARELVSRGHEVTVITSDILSLNPRRYVDRSEIEIEGVHVKYFRTWMLLPRFSFLISPKLLLWLRDSLSQFDVVHVHFARDWIPVMVAKKATQQGIPVFLQPHGMLGRTDGFRKYLDKLVISRLLQAATAVLPLQATEMDSIAAISPTARLLTLPNGIKNQPFNDVWSRNALSNRTVLFLARLHPRKRVLSIIEAVKIIKNSGQGVRLRIVGPDEGDLRRANQRVVEYGLEQSVDFVGPLAHDKVISEFLQASIYVLPAVDEPFGMTVIEAMALGVPTIVTEGIHIRDMLWSNRAAMIVPPDSESIAKAILELLNNPDLATELSKNGKELIARDLTIEKVVTRLEQIYHGTYRSRP